MNRSISLIRNTIKNNNLHRLYCTQVKENEPVKFSTSEAARRKLPSVFRNKQAEQMPWYQPYCVVGSVAIFLLYFCVFREENDVDLEFNKTLYDRIKGMEKQQLLQSYRFNKEQGLGVADIEKRLQEIELQEANVAE
uniref:HM00015 protein n=1 Tax=Heliconius melpomene TaxID=34740 RepID=C9S276_HELME|nr:HM00015 [Heliconius melpomene]